MDVCVQKRMLMEVYGEDKTHDFIESVEVDVEHLCQIKGVSSLHL